MKLKSNFLSSRTQQMLSVNLLSSYDPFVQSNLLPAR